MQRIESLEKQNYHATLQHKSVEAIQYGYGEKEVIVPPRYLQHPPIPPITYTPPLYGAYNSLWSSPLPSTKLSPSDWSSSSLTCSPSSTTTLSPLFPSSVYSYSSSSSELSQSWSPTYVLPKCPWLDTDTASNITGSKSVATTITAVSPLISSNVQQPVVNLFKPGNVTIPSVNTVSTSKENPQVSISGNHTASSANILETDDDDTLVPMCDMMKKEKENTPLPPIDHENLSNPNAVINKYPKLLSY